MPSFAAVLLDVDGTLINSIDLSVQTLREALLKLDGEAPPDDVVRQSMHLPTVETARRFRPDDTKTLVDSWNKAVQARFHENCMYPGVKEGILSLKKDGFRLGAVSAETRRELDHTLGFFGISSLFDTTVALEEVPRRKPAPDALQRALAILNVLPSEALYLGDSPTDLQAARAAGMTSVAALWGCNPREALLAETPDQAFDSFKSFVAWVKRVSCPSPSLRAPSTV